MNTILTVILDQTCKNIGNIFYKIIWRILFSGMNFHAFFFPTLIVGDI